MTERGRNHGPRDEMWKREHQGGIGGLSVKRLVNLILSDECNRWPLLDRLGIKYYIRVFGLSGITA